MLRGRQAADRLDLCDVCGLGTPAIPDARSVPQKLAKPGGGDAVARPDPGASRPVYSTDAGVSGKPCTAPPPQAANAAVAAAAMMIRIRVS